MPDALLLTHGAGSDRNAPLLVRVATAFEGAGLTVQRFDLPFRQERQHGPPRPGDAARDREGLHAAAQVLHEKTGGRLFIGGHSYGGRQASMLAAEDPSVADALLLLSYPLHPPRRPAELRTGHFTNLRTRALFVHGTRDPFGTIEELQRALLLLPQPADLFAVERAGHDLKQLDPQAIVSRFLA